MQDWRWRLNNLYKIVNKSGEKVQFVLNQEQSELFSRLWTRNIILKPRQRGMTTAIQLFMLDQCLFNDNTSCGVIAHGLSEAQDIFQNKIKFAYDNLPAWLKSIKQTKKCSGKQIYLSNDSSIRVGTSMRSGTIRILHISEFAKICRQWPERAREIVTGSLPSVPADGMIFIESTAEGDQGYFYDYSTEAQQMAIAARRLTRADFRFHFFAWFEAKDYVLSDTDTKLTVIPDRLQEYFYELETRLGIDLSANQKAWYTKQEKLLGDDMFREYPSTSEEAFKRVIRGAYFLLEFNDIYAQKRITNVPYNKGVPVQTWWDLGMSDMMCIWFTQTIGGAIHVINYYENSGHGMKHYVDELRKREYSYGGHYGPHDLEVRELMGDGKSRVDKAREWGIHFTVVPRIENKHDAIDLARDALGLCVFDEANCELGISRLKNYKRDWDQRLGRYKDTPLHDINSNGADAFMTMACGHPMFARIKNDRAAKILKAQSSRNQ
jgi:hypothetical protein